MMKRKITLRRRVPALLLTLVMLLAMTPAAQAVVVDRNSECPKSTNTSKSHDWRNEEVVSEANCHEGGLLRYTCSYCSNTSYVETKVDPDNHDAVCTDNGDGTHSGVCEYHGKNGEEIVREKHNYDKDGICRQCRALEYSAIKVTVSSPELRFVPLDSTDYKLALDDVHLTLNGKDITNDYNLTYNWFYQGRQVSSDEAYTLPTSITGKEGSYVYTCFVQGLPKVSQSAQPVQGSCMVTVRVEDLIAAQATVGRDEKFLELGEADNWSSLSVAEQIFDAVSLRSRYTLDYVCFESTDSKLGGLDTKGRSVKYFYDATGSRESLEDIRFRPSGEASGAFSVNFYAYDTNGKEFPGVLTVTVQQHAGSMDVMLVTAKDEPVALSTEAFEDFWAESYSKGDLDRISFLEMPNSAEGILYTDFTSLSSTGARVRSGELFYVDPGRRDAGIDEVTFVPGSRQTEYVIIPFTAYGTNDRGNSANRDGELYIFISRDSVAPITRSVTPGVSCKLDAKDFLTIFQAATDSKSTSFYIQLLDLPDSGTLYANYNASTNRGTRLTESNVSGWSFYYSGRGDLISDMVYVPGTAASDTVRYVACDSQGKMLYVGELCFTTSSLKVPYKSTSAGVSFRAADFETLNGTAAKLSTVSFTPPPAAQGALYYGRTALSAGTAITGDSVWFNVSSSNTAVNANSMNGVSFVPRAGYSGEVSIPFSAYDVSGRKLAGTVKITVTATSTTDPVNPTNPTNPTNPINPSTPAPDPGFSDVPKSSSTSWYFNQLATLVASDVIGGYPDGSFQPGRAVTYGEALKMIMRAAGYEELAPTGKHWASGYLSRAVSDGLLASSQVNLDMAITRYTVAEVAAKALRVQGYNLPVSTRTVSPFSDMTMEVSSAPYVLALVDAKIVQGTTLSNGNVVYYGVNAFRRSEVAVVVYNMMAYRSTG